MARGEDRFALRVACGSYLLATSMARQQGDAERRKKMQKVITIKREAIAETFPRRFNRPPSAREARVALVSGRWSDRERLGFVIEMAFTYPFLPYELKIDSDNFTRALVELAGVVGVDESVVDEIESVKEDAEKELKHSSALRKLALGGGVLAGVAIIAAAPYAVPALGVATSAATGGAAATAHGLALLGGGSLAAGGTGMAGGMAVISAAGAGAAGMAGLSARGLINELSPEAVEVQLVKTMVAFALIDEPKGGAEAILQELDEECDDLARTLERERGLNEKRAGRVRDLERKFDSYRRAIAWMERVASSEPN